MAGMSLSDEQADAFTFKFIGDLEGQGGQEQLAEQIATAGQNWSATHWRKVDMAAYTARLYLEWARLQEPLRGNADFVYSRGMEV
jgi:hypothetical protein